MGACARERRRPNVFFIIIDDLNDWVGCLGGHPQARTPNIDRLAMRGVLFTRAYCTAPLCNPSRTSLLTGIRPSTSGIYENDQPWNFVFPPAATLPGFFRRNGYSTIGAGKIFHHKNRSLWSTRFKKRGYPSPQEPAHRFRGDPSLESLQWAPTDAEDWQTEEGKLVGFVRKAFARPQKRPFFLAVGTYRPHLPWYVPRKYFEQFTLDSIQLPRVREDDLDDVPPLGREAANPSVHRQIVEAGQWAPAVQAYLASIASVDAHIGMLIDLLDASPYADDTIVLICSDHGFHLGEKLHWHKSGLWEEATRVPLAIVAPGVSRAEGRCSISP